MAYYLIKLTPHDKFFFGTGKEFGPDNQNYFIESGYFPQQTSLLGMLRYQLLKQSGDAIFKNNKIQNSDEAKKLIGKSSFTLGGNNSFGVIKSLSPVFLMQDKHKYFPLNREYQYGEHDEIKEVLHLLELKTIGEEYLLEGYDAKQELNELWRNTQGTITLKLEDIFKAQSQVGIKKNYAGTAENNAFYQQTFQKFADANWCFAFYVEIDKKLENSNAVVLGGERQTFSMRVTETEGEDYNNENYLKYASSKTFHKLILTSDAYISDNLKDVCDFAITTLKNFR
jgi:CRISPR-associated protein Cmr3